MRNHCVRLTVCGLFLVVVSTALAAQDPKARPSSPNPRPATAKTDAVSRLNHPESVPVAAPEAAPAQTPTPEIEPEIDPAKADAEPQRKPGGGLLESADAMRTVQSVVLFGAVSLAPVAFLMITPFVRINIVLILLRQALGSPQVPGNQVLMALALLLSALVMRPVGEKVYADAIEPYMAGKAGAGEAWNAGSKPIKTFMVDQIVRTNHQDYLWTLHERSAVATSGQAEPQTPEDFPIGVVAPAFILSELTTALMMGFFLYLPFLIIDLVVSAVLAAMGLFMLPPTLVATPVKLIVFVLADGWLLVSDMLLSSFSVPGA